MSRLLSPNNIKAELSYAYLHAIAARAGFSCEVSNRHADGDGVDAVVRAKERFYPNSILTRFTVEVQLKASSIQPNPDRLKRYPFQLDVKLYDRLRDVEAGQQQILVVLFLPSDDGKWLSHSTKSLVSRRCAYWVSLRGAPQSVNQRSQTVYIPQKNLFSVDGLRSVFAERSLGGWIRYE